MTLGDTRVLVASYVFCYIRLYLFSFYHDQRLLSNFINTNIGFVCQSIDYDTYSPQN